jgi:hypothetical protein
MARVGGGGERGGGLVISDRTDVEKNSDPHQLQMPDQYDLDHSPAMEALSKAVYRKC